MRNILLSSSNMATMTSHENDLYRKISESIYSERAFPGRGEGYTQGWGGVTIHWLKQSWLRKEFTGKHKILQIYGNLISLRVSLAVIVGEKILL